ncbi:recombinase family protein, partial [Roseococcus sp. SDR]|uniref:recombinase family protein n=1 Tax=Roseococcus sp. SDR TaxID=2835532 RepID=UPI001BCF665B
MRRATLPTAAATPAPRVALYARYSDERQSVHSIEDQFRICRTYAENQGWEVVQLFEDAAITGRITQRPGYQALLQAMREERFDIVLAEALDRISRDQEHTASFFKHIQFNGVRLFTLADGEVTPLHVGLKGTMNALYLTDLAAKTRRGLEGRVRAGRATGRAPYGYRRVTSVQRPDGELERGLREIIPEEAAIVRRIFEEYAAGSSARTIARGLNTDGIPGPQGGVWNPMTLSGRPFSGDGILRNRLYLGKVVWNRRSRVMDPISGRTKRRFNAIETRVEGETPGLRIVDDPLWAAVQARLAAASPPKDGPEGKHRFWERRGPRHLFSGKLVCGTCGAPCSANQSRRYSCNGHFRGLCDNPVQVSRPKLEAAVLAVLADQMMDPALAEAFAETFSREWKQFAAEQGRDASKLQRDLQATERKLENLLDAIADGLRSPGLQAKLTALEADRERLTLAIEEAKPEPVRLLPNLGDAYRRAVQRLRDGLAASDNPAASDAVRQLVERVVIHPTKPYKPPRIIVEGRLA